MIGATAAVADRAVLRLRRGPHFMPEYIGRLPPTSWCTPWPASGCPTACASSAAYSPCVWSSAAPLPTACPVPTTGDGRPTSSTTPGSSTTSRTAAGQPGGGAGGGVGRRRALTLGSCGCVPGRRTAAATRHRLRDPVRRLAPPPVRDRARRLPTGASPPRADPAVTASGPSAKQRRHTCTHA